MGNRQLRDAAALHAEGGVYAGDLLAVEVRADNGARRASVRRRRAERGEQAEGQYQGKGPFHVSLLGRGAMPLGRDAPHSGFLLIFAQRRG